MTRTSTRRTAGMITAGLVGLLLVAACSGGANNTSSSGAEPAVARDAAGSSAGGSAVQDGGSAKSPSQGQDPSAAKEFSVGQTVLTANGEKLARRATIAMKVPNLARAADQVRAISTASDGVILGENIGSGDGGAVPLQDRSKVSATTYGEIVISVPSARLDAVLADLAKLGTLIRRDSSTENVSQQFVDTQARLKTMRASVDRVRALMTQTKDLTQVVNLESELSRRQADLESLESQMASLTQSVERSPIQVSLTTDDGVIAEDPGQGFLAGISSGWKAFTGSVVVLLTILGALLPFAVALGVLGVPVWLTFRRRHPKPAPVPVAATE